MSPEDFAVETEESADFNVNTQPVLSDEAAALLDEMLVFYRKLAEQGDDTDEFRQRIAEANRRVGDIRRRLGQFGPAEQAYRQAIAVYSQLADGGKTNPKQVAALASIYNELGEVHRSARQSDLAREAFDNARSILEPICAQECPPEVRYELARSLFLSVHRSDGWARRGPGPGFGTPNGKRTGSRRDGKSAPGKSPQGETRPGEGFGRVGEFARDAEKIRRAVELLEDLNAEFQVPDYQQLLALCYSERHSHLRFQNPDQSAEAIAKSISLLEDLVARYPQNPDYRFTLSTVYVKRLREFWTRPTAEELADIKTRATTALALLQELHRDHPGVPEYALSELEVHRSLASRLHAAGRHQEAELHFLAAIQLYDSLGEFELSDSFNIMRAAFTRNLYADSLLEQFRKAKEAGEEPRVEWLLKARENLQTWVDRLASYADADPRHYMAVGFSYKRLATICSELGDEAAAAEATASMHKYLPQDRWGDSERNGQRGSPTVDREAANRSATPSRSEQFSEDNK